MTTPAGRFYYGDFRLWGPAIEPIEVPERTLLQEFQGVDQPNVLVVPSSENLALTLRARTFGKPNPSAITHAGFVAILRAERQGLAARASRADALTWVADDTRSKVVGGYAAPTVTSAGHGYANGDVVLIRRAAVGSWLLATVGGVLPNSFTATAVAGTVPPGYAPQVGDEIHLVEAYWLGMVSQLLEEVRPEEDGGFYASELVYTFRGSGRYDYARQTAAVGS